jgi:hypothetical protein
MSNVRQYEGKVNVVTDIEERIDIGVDEIRIIHTEDEESPAIDTR